VSNPSPPETPPRALVTGGNGNLGAAVARRLAAAGYEVHVTVQDGTARAGMRVHAVDLTDPAAVARMAAAIGGPLDAVVATVGGFAGGPFAAMDPAVFDQQYALNLKSTLLTLHATYPLLRANPRGSSVVLVGNRAALSSGPGVAVSAAMKAAVVHLAKSLAAEWKPDGIRVNAIAPGIMDTPQNRRDIPDADPSGWPTPEQVADVVAFLVAREGAIVSGAVVPVFGRS
jgi:NAD(P)-dependent dehydrogenase (short-subunit alcohol dehydrogenase family)